MREAVAVFMVLSFVGGAYGQTADALPETVIAFFLLVNATEHAVNVTARVNGRELFVQEIAATPEVHPGAKDVVPRGRHPARELKVPLSRNAKWLEVEEVNSGTRAAFDIGGFAKIHAGFRITLEKRRVLLSQDYLPIR